jgi:hypothetical protein
MCAAKPRAKANETAEMNTVTIDALVGMKLLLL